MITKIKEWFKDLFAIVRNYHSNYDRLIRRIHNLEVQNSKLTRILKERTQVNVEVSPHPRAPHNVILTGRYKNRDYVEIFTIKTEDLHELIELLQKMEQFAEIRRIDTGPYQHMRRVFEGELDMDK